MARILTFLRFCSASALLGSGVTPTLVSPHSFATAGGSGVTLGLAGRALGPRALTRSRSKPEREQRRPADIQATAL